MASFRIRTGSRVAADYIQLKQEIHDQRIYELLRTEVSWSPDGSTELAMACEIFVPSDAGVYMIHDLRGALYVGLSRNLRKRFRQHDHLRRNRLLRLALDKPVGTLKFSWRLVDDEMERIELERHLVSILQPVCNTQLLNIPIL